MRGLISSVKVLSGVVWLSMALIGCVGPQPVGTKLSPESLASSPLPRYREGVTFVYSDGSWEQVTKADGDEVRWINHQRRPSAGSADFTYSRSEWENSGQRGVRRFVEESGTNQGAGNSLWPLAMGKSSNFMEYGETTDKKSGAQPSTYDNYYRCRVDGAEAVTVGAGTFDSWRISCTRYSNNSGPARKYPREYHTWYYAPVLNHWVLELRDYTSSSSEDRRKELVAVMPDLTNYTNSRQTLSDIKHHFQDALEKGGSNTLVRYVATDQDLQVTTTPIKTMKHPEGQVCRQYEQRIDINGRSDRYYGMACRGDSGVWMVPRR